MSVENRQRFYGAQEMPLSKMGVFNVTEARTLKTFERNVLAQVSTALGGAFTITLPQAAEVVGIFTIELTSVADVLAVTVADPAGAAGLADFTLDTAADRVVLYSNGYRWYDIGSVIA